MPDAPPTYPWRLTWPEVDPARHPFDPAGVPAVIRSLPPAATVPSRPPGRSGRDDVYPWGAAEGRPWADTMSAAVVAHYGLWAGGWRWGVGEADFDGGPVHAWCCPLDSMSTDPAETLDVVAGSLLEWRGWLADLAERFDRFLPLPHDDLPEFWERSVAHLITVVADRTCGDGAWWYHCEQVLGWFLTAAGVPESHHAPVIKKAVGDSFRSFFTPSNRVITEVAERFAAEAQLLPGPAPRRGF